jgi:DNA-directed RNA polymerase subunit M/transcription elongation factor TFIIS
MAVRSEPPEEDGVHCADCATDAGYLLLCEFRDDEIDDAGGVTCMHCGHEWRPSPLPHGET